MFPELPSDLTTLSDEDLARLIDEYAAAFEEARASAATPDDLATINAAADNIAALAGERTRRDEAAQQVADEVEQAAARVAQALGQEEAPELDAEGNPVTPAPEVDADGNPVEPVTAAGSATATPPRHHTRVPAIARREPDLAAMGSRVPQAHRPAPTDGQRLRILAAPDLRQPAGSELTVPQVAQAIVDRQDRLRGATGVEGEVVPVAQVVAQPDARRHLRQDATAVQNTQVIEAVVAAMQHPDEHGGMEALVAAGGLCAPVAPYYDIQVLAEAARPVRDALPGFNADRGGVTLIPPPSLGDLTGAITVVTAAQDLAGGAPSQKACLHVACAAARTYQVDAVARCVEFGNFAARAYPEQVEAWLALSMAAHARRAETGLLDAIAANSLPATAALALGAAAEVYARAFQAAAAYRSRNRMDDDAVLSALYPSWIADAINADRVRAGFDVLSRAEVLARFREGGINASFYQDSKTGGGQVFGAQAVTFADAVLNSTTLLTSATAAFTAADIGRRIEGAGIPSFTTIAAVASGTNITLSQAATATGGGVTITIYGRSAALLTFPSTMVWYLFAPGTFLFLDGGTLDFGLVRDSTLNTRNDYRIMVESFEKLAYVGLESLEVTQTICANGEIGARRTGGAALVCPV